MHRSISRKMECCISNIHENFLMMHKHNKRKRAKRLTKNVQAEERKQNTYTSYTCESN